MTNTTAYEIHTLKEDKWELDTILERKDDAVQEARRLLAYSKRIAGVKVIEEKFDSEEDHSVSHVIFTEIRGQEKTRAKAKQAEEKKEVIPSETPPKPKTPEAPESKGSATNYFLILVLVIGAVLLGVLGIAYYYTGIAN